MSVNKSRYNLARQIFTLAIMERERERYRFYLSINLASRILLFLRLLFQRLKNWGFFFSGKKKWSSKNKARQKYNDIRKTCHECHIRDYCISHENATITDKKCGLFETSVLPMFPPLEGHSRISIDIFFFSSVPRNLKLRTTRCVLVWWQFESESGKWKNREYLNNSNLFKPLVLFFYHLFNLSECSGIISWVIRTTKYEIKFIRKRKIRTHQLKQYATILFVHCQFENVKKFLSHLINNNFKFFNQSRAIFWYLGRFN